jgi:hypothetical protein
MRKQRCRFTILRQKMEIGWDSCDAYIVRTHLNNPVFIRLCLTLSVEVLSMVAKL